MNSADTPETESADQDHQRDSEGSALVEFLALSMLLMLPSLWFLLAIAQVQAAAYAAAGAADQAAKIYIGSEALPEQRAHRSELAVIAALADFGIEPEQATVDQHCSADCQEPGSIVGFTVEVRVPVPLVPELGGVEHRLVTVSASSSQVQGE